MPICRQAVPTGHQLKHGYRSKRGGCRHATVAILDGTFDAINGTDTGDNDGTVLIGSDTTFQIGATENGVSEIVFDNAGT